jgi:signal transduction histidine kinase
MGNKGIRSASRERDRLSKALLVGSVGSLGALLLMIGAVARWENQRIEAEVRDRIREDALYRVETVRHCLTSEAASEHAGSLEQAIRSSHWLEVLLKRQVQFDPVYEYIDIVSPSGKILVHCDDQGIRGPAAGPGTQPTAASEPASRPSTGGTPVAVAHHSVPFVVRGVELGTLRMGVSESRINQRIAQLCRPVRHAFLLLELICVGGLVAGALTIWKLSARERRRERAAAREQYLAELGIVASKLVHEIRNPLNAMRMQVAVIRRQLEKGDSSSIALGGDQLGRLEQEVTRLDRLASEFLAFGRPPADEPESIKLSALIRDVAEFLRPEFEHSGARVRVEVEPGGEGLYVRMDRSKLRRVLLNLAENAREAMSGGQMTIQLARRSRRQAIIRVRDTGSGIPDHELPLVFDTFFTTKQEGSGLGLAIVKRIIEDAGGSVGVESRESEGTCFAVTLPLTRVAADGG